MRINDYTFIDPDGSDAGTELEALGAWRCERLARCLEEFVQTDTNLSCKVLGDGVEIYLVPPRAVLAHIPDAAALVSVDHRQRRIEIVHIRREYGGFNESRQWTGITDVARELLNQRP